MYGRVTVRSGGILYGQSMTTRLTVWANRLFWVCCVGLGLLTAGFAAERHLRRLSAATIEPSLTQTSEEISVVRQEIDELREQIKSLAEATAKVDTTTSTPVVVTKREVVVDGSAAGASPATPTGLVNLNTADKTSLMSLPGIGESYAERIISGRPYAAIEDLLNVKGIGEKTLAKLRSLVTL